MTIARQLMGGGLGAWVLGLVLAVRASAAGEPLARFELPDAWEARFWADPGVKKLLALGPEEQAALVPVQAGLRSCRCPACEAPDVEDPLSWSLDQPDLLTCRRCAAHFPNDAVPARVDKKVPEEVVEVLPRVWHHYPYHAVDPDHQLAPDERIYLAAKRDYEAREFLARSALYAAVRHREQPHGAEGKRLARLVSVLLVRFAQVYPAYATHFDQPGQPKFFQPADLPPPYRRGYRTAKWDWSGSQDVPLNLVIAYALIRDDPAMAEAGRLLGDPHPKRTIEEGLFRASANFVLRQPEEYQEESLLAYRGVLAVGRLLGDEALIREVKGRLSGFAERGFTHDGLWRGGDLAAHRRVVAYLDGWIARLLPDEAASVPILALARSAGRAARIESKAAEVQRAAWPGPEVGAAPVRGPILLGGAGLARLAVGRGADALDLEMRGFGDLGEPRSNRLALRLAVGGRTVLGDLDELPPSVGGFERATASHNAVLVDGLNQGELPALAQTRSPAPAADCLFFAADPDFQVATMGDRYAYPQSTTRYRQTLIAVAGPSARYAVGVFEVRGGLQHDQLFHAGPGSSAGWRSSVAMTPGPATLLPPTIARVPTARAADGRWLVQAMGEIGHLSGGRIEGPATATLTAPGTTGVRLHILPEAPMTVFAGRSPDPSSSTSSADEPGRAALVLRRRSTAGSSLSTRFVTVFEPIGAASPLRRVGRVETRDGVVVLAIETADGPEHLMINPSPGTRRSVTLADGRTLTTDGLAVRVTRGGLSLAGGTRAVVEGLEVRQAPATGAIRAATRRASPESGARGFFEAAAPLPDPAGLAGRTLLIRHGDGPVRGWTLVRVENRPEGGARLHVREEPGFRVDPRTGAAEYYQFPRETLPGPHTFRVARIARSGSL